MKLLKDEIKDIIYKYYLDTGDNAEIADEIVDMLSKRFELTSFELNTKNGIKITSDNTNLNTKVEMIETGNELSVTSVMWELDPNVIGQIGRLTIGFV